LAAANVAASSKQGGDRRSAKKPRKGTTAIKSDLSNQNFKFKCGKSQTKRRRKEKENKKRGRKENSIAQGGLRIKNRNDGVSNSKKRSGDKEWEV